MEDTLTRRLAVILHADIVDSTALVQSNETLAHQRILEVFRSFSAIIKSYHGVTQEIRGDALVAEFSRVSDAACASLTFQAANATYTGELTDDIRPVVRIGISLGEVVVADGTITGEGVVLAQRLKHSREEGKKIE